MYGEDDSPEFKSVYAILSSQSMNRSVGFSKSRGNNGSVVSSIIVFKNACATTDENTIDSFRQPATPHRNRSRWRRARLRWLWRIIQLQSSGGEVLQRIMTPPIVLLRFPSTGFQPKGLGGPAWRRYARLLMPDR